MKLRLGFVSNSSSSSFVIKKSDLTSTQIEKIWNHIEWAKTINSKRETPNKYRWLDAWKISEDDETISGYTTMDNFSMDEFLEDIGIPEQVIDYEGQDGGRVWDILYPDKQYTTVAEFMKGENT